MNNDRCAVGVNILSKIAIPLAEGIKMRWNNGNLDPLNIIICENLLNANHYLEKLIKDQMNDKGKALFDNQIGLVEASIGRMVPIITPELQEGDILRICVEKYCELPVDKGIETVLSNVSSLEKSSKESRIISELYRKMLLNVLDL